MHSTSAPSEEVSTQNLRQRLIAASQWTVVGHFSAQLLRFGSNLVLTRLLAPDLFGVMSVGYVVFTGLGMISDLGLSSVVARSPQGASERFLNVVWVTQIARGALMTLGALAVSVALGLGLANVLSSPNSVYTDPRLPALLAIVSLYGLVEGLESTKSLLARRNLSLGALTKVDLIAQVGTTAFILVWAAVDPSIWALGAGWLFGVFLKTSLSHWMLPGPANRLEWDSSAFHEIVEFGKWALVSSPISFLLSSGDRLILGALIDAPGMGFYAIASLIVGALQAMILKIIGQSIQPALSEVLRNRPLDLRATLYRIRLPLDIACAGCSGLLFALGVPIVRLLYDNRYQPAGWMLSIIALTLVVTQYNIFDQYLISVGRMKLLSGLNLVRLLMLCSLMYAFYGMWGAQGAILAIPASALANTLIVLTVQGRLHLLSLRRELRVLLVFGLGVALGCAVRAVAT